MQQKQKRRQIFAKKKISTTRISPLETSNNLFASRKGATLIGVLIGISVLSISLASQLKLISATIKRETELRNLIIATNLAREGVELGVLWRNTNTWNELQGIDSCPDIYDPYAQDNNCSKVLKFNQNFFEYEGTHSAQSFQFKRRVKIDNCQLPAENNCLEINSEVSWGEKPNEKVALSKKIFNWYE